MNDQNPLATWSDPVGLQRMQTQGLDLGALGIPDTSTAMDTTTATATVEDSRPVVVITPAEYQAIEETITALAHCKADIYVRGTELVRIAAGDSNPTIRRSARLPIISALPLPVVREEMTRHIRYQEEVQKKDEIDARDIHPPQWLSQAIYQRQYWPGLRHLTAISTTPILRPDGTIHQIPGHDPATGVVFIPDPSTTFPAIPESPDQSDAIEAVDVLLDPVVDFNFETPEHRSAWMAALLTVIARHAFDGPAPLFAFDANVRGAGKTKLAQIIGNIALGEDTPIAGYAHKGEEMAKRITSVVIAGDAVCCLDNIDGPFGNDAIDRCLTGSRWRDRVLGTNTLTDLPLSTVWFATGNNLSIAADTARRVLQVRLDVMTESPEERTSFKYPNVVDHVRRNRGKIVAAALTLLRAYIIAGRPQPKPAVTPFGSFEGWCDLVRNAILWTYQPDPCATRASAGEHMDSVANTLDEFLSAWSDYDPHGLGVVVSQMVSSLYAREYAPNDAPSVAMRSALETLCGCPSGRPPSAKTVAYKLRAFRRRVCQGRYLDTVGERGKTGYRWKLHQKGVV